MSAKLSPLVGWLLFAASAFAQTSTSQISGTVRDSSGAVIPAAAVTLTNDATGIAQKQATTDAGLYAFPSIPVGAYTVRVEAAGFKTAVKSGNVMQVGTPGVVDMTLEVGTATEVVNVAASAEVLQTSNATIGNVVEQKAIVNLPLNGRNPLNLLIFEAGVVQRSGGTINVNGARSGAVNVTIDGIEANESTNPNPVNNIFRLNPDNVQEFKVTTSNPTAEEGRNSGANVNIATRSGTNEFHGTLFEFFRNTKLNAKEFYTNAQGGAKPLLQLNQYGFEIGGPIRRNKTFFFFSWQGQQVNFADPIDKVFGETVDLYTPSALAGNYRYWVSNPLNPISINGQRITQNTTLLVDPRTGQYAPGVRDCAAPTDSNCVASYNVFNNDPLRRGIDSSVKSVLGGYPAPNSYAAGDGLNTGIYVWNTPVKIRGPQYMTRIDHTINTHHTLWGRWLGAKQTTLSGDPANSRPQVLPGYPPRGEVFRPANNIAIGLRSVLSPRVVNELTLGYSRFTFLFTQGEANPLFPNTPRFTFNNSDVDYTANGRTFRAVNTPQIIENISFLTGAHVFRFGANIRMYQHNDQRADVGGTSLTPAISLSRTTRPPGAAFNLPTITTGNTPGISSNDSNRLQGTVNDLLGIPASLTQVFQGDLRSDTFAPFRSGEGVTLWAQGQRAKQYNFFAQDEWKVKRNITLSYGVRWEINPPISEAGGRSYVPNKPIDGSQGDVTYVQSDRWYKNYNWGAVAPRFGVTWSPGNSNKFVIRAGYGVAFDPIATFQASSVATAVPGQTYRCQSTIAGSGAISTTPGCQTITDVRLGSGFPREINPPSVKPSTFLTPPRQVSANAPNARVFDPNLKLPTVHMWNLTLQRELPGAIAVSVGYVGRRGTRLYRIWDMNQQRVEGTLPTFLAMQKNRALGNGCRPDGTLATGTPCGGATPVPWLQQGIIDSTFANATASITDLDQNAAGNFGNRVEQTTLRSGLRPNQQFNQIVFLDNGGDSIYHSAQLSVRKRFGQGLLLNGSYTLSKSIDNLSIDPVGSTVGGGLTTTNSRTPADNRNYDNERARSDFDQRHVVNMTGIFELPFGKGKKFATDASKLVNALIGGWSLNGIYTYQSGEPFSVRSGVFTNNNTGQSRAALKPGVALPRAQLQEKPGVIGPVLFANSDAFTFPEPGGLGLGRNIFQGPSYWNLDGSVAKGFSFTERVKAVFRAEFFNALNHPNFRNPRDASSGTPAITSPSLFGSACCVTLSTASSSTTNQNGESWRVIQLALKLSF
ncbi:MAG: TonB-dependent receptor [Bryobacteraceae bacterium]|nr:TonB-dependent receptor [Bryobacteraceae bacterium]